MILVQFLDHFGTQWKVILKTYLHDRQQYVWPWHIISNEITAKCQMSSASCYASMQFDQSAIITPTSPYVADTQTTISGLWLRTHNNWNSNGLRQMSEAMHHVSSPVKQSVTINIHHCAWLIAGLVSQALSAYCYRPAVWFLVFPDGFSVLNSRTRMLSMLQFVLFVHSF